MNFLKKPRIYNSVHIKSAERGFAIYLDAHPLCTPRQIILHIPTKKLATEVAQEWMQAQQPIKLQALPMTRFCFSAYDLSVLRRQLFLDKLNDYASSDLLCYRMKSPADLIKQQNALWNPLLTWAKTALNAPLRITDNISYVQQPLQSLQNLSKILSQYDHFQLVAVNDMVLLSGSLIITLAVLSKHIAPKKAWQAASLDENWQMHHWGDDEDTKKCNMHNYQNFMHAYQFFKMATIK